MEYILSVLLSIVGNLLTPTTKKFLRWPVRPDSPKILPIPDVSENTLTPEANKEAIREYNRQRVSRLTRLLTTHGITFLFLFGAFYLPLVLKSLSGKDIAFSETRFVIFGIERFIDHQNIGLLSLLLALLLYLPLWFLSQPIGHFLATIWDHLDKVSPSRYTALITLSFIFLTFFVAGNWIFVLFPQYTYWYSVILPFVFIGFGAVLSQRR